MLFEVFTTNEDESEAIHVIRNLNVSAKGILKKKVKEAFGDKGIQMVKKMIGR